MKKLTLFFSLIIFVQLLYSQAYTGINAGYTLSTNSTNEIDNGIGGDLLIGYSINPKTDIGLMIGNIWFKSIADKYRISSLKADFNYYFLKNTVRPYLGLSSGFFQKRFLDPLGVEHGENGIGIIPSVGVSFNPSNSNSFRILTELTFNKIFTDHQLDYFTFNFGMIYYFHFSQ